MDFTNEIFDVTTVRSKPTILSLYGFTVLKRIPHSWT